MKRSSTYIRLKFLIVASLCAAFNTRYRRPCCVNKMSTRCVRIVCSQVVEKLLINARLFKTTSYKVFELHRPVPSAFFPHKTHLKLVFTYVFTQDNFPTNPNGPGRKVSFPCNHDLSFALVTLLQKNVTVRSQYLSRKIILNQSLLTVLG